VSAVPRPNLAERPWRDAVRRQAASQAKAGLDELEYWAEKGLPAAEEVLARASAGFGRQE
jgi:hypothetical protein